MGKALDQEARINEEAIEYRPTLRKVRRIESQINLKLRDIKELKKEQVLQKTLKNTDLVDEISGEIAYIQDEIDELKTRIPASWSQTYKDFKSLMKEEEKLRNIYRRKGEKSYQTIERVAIILASSQEITQLKSEYSLIFKDIIDLENKEKVQRLNDLIKKYRNVSGTSEFKKNISKAIKELKKKKVKEDRVAKSLDNALKEINLLETWVLASRTKLEAPLEIYLEKTKTTLRKYGS